MKKLLFTLLVIASIFTSLKAEPVRFGVVAGMNITKEETSSGVSYKGWSPDSQNGWFAGIQLKFTLPIIGLGFDASAVYSQENVTLPIEENGENVVQKMGYVAIPVHLRYDLSLPVINHLVEPFIFTGPQAALNTTKINEAYHNSVTSKDLVWRYDLGAGVILLNHLQAAYSYSFPLTSTYEGNIISQSKDLSNDYKSGVHRISLTYFF